VTQPPKNVVASVLARLRNVAQEAGLSFSDILQRIGEPVLANEFSQVVADLVEFLMPVAKAAATSADYPVRWEPLGPWQD
jgi:hypothetical protein